MHTRTKCLFAAFPLLSLLLALPAPAAEPPQPATSASPAAPPAETQMFIWGGGTTREEAEKSLAGYTESGGGWEEFYTLAEGFPRVLESKTVPGLKPGFFIVALGVCPAEQARPLLEHFKAFKPSVYARAVTWTEKAPACPKASGTAKVVAVHGWKKKGLELTAVEVEEGESWRLLMELRDKSGKVLESLETNAEEAKRAAGNAISCDTNMVLYDAAGPNVAIGCDEPGCTTLAHRESEIRYRIDGEHIQSKEVEKSFTPGQCD